MNIKCPKCGKDHDVPDEKIPADKFRASCRGCKEQFVVVLVECAQCGLRMQEGQSCPQCEGKVKSAQPEPVVAPPCTPMEAVSQVQSSSEETLQSHRVQFSGKGGEFFRIWIVNLFLTIVTLGIYTPWAKVRTRQYFYNHTTLAGEPFEYLADPMVLLRGYLLIAGGFLIYSFSQMIPVVSGLIALFFYAAFPILVYKSLRFYGHNSSFKNIRFSFLGSISEAYTTYLALPLAIPFTLGLIVPYWMYYKKKYFFENFAFGGTQNVFTAKAKPFYGFYLKAAFMMLVPILMMGVIVAVAIPKFDNLTNADGINALFVIVLILLYGGLILGGTFIQQYVYAKTMNYCWQQSDLGAIKFESTLAPFKLMLIQAVNVVAIIFSAGLLFPWAKVRKTKYILENLTLHVTGGLDNFTAVNTGDEAALGEAAMDFFDFEIGL